ncbi:MAG: SAF domain-containing protein [Pelagibacteraceae bacterium]
MCRPYHYIGLELAQSIYSIALEKKPTGSTLFYNAEVASYAKKDLKVGEKLDGEGGFCARGKLITSSSSKEQKILPLGLSDGAILKKDIKKDDIIKLSDVELDLPESVIKAREYQYNLIN